MTIQKAQAGTALALILEGRLDTMTAPELEREFVTSLPGVTELTLDLSSAWTIFLQPACVCCFGPKSR